MSGLEKPPLKSSLRVLHLIDNLACARYPGSTAMLWIDWALVALRTDTSAVSKPRKRIVGSMDRILRFMEKTPANCCAFVSL